MAFDRDVVVRCIQRHYDLLVRAAYLDPSIIQQPPPSGWTEQDIMADVLRVLGRSEAVIDLLRHLPYISAPRNLGRYEIYEETTPINYLRDYSPLRDSTADSCHGKTVDDFDMFPADADWPSSFISLTGGREATWWIIDTEEGNFEITCQQSPNTDHLDRCRVSCRCVHGRF